MNAALYHYTCDHGRIGIEQSGGLLLPVRSTAEPSVYENFTTWQLPLVDLIWLTDLAEPLRDGLGLTSHTVRCDRTVHRYRVTDDLGIQHWPSARRNYPAELRRGLEHVDGALPIHWWIARAPVPVVYAPASERVA